MQRIIKDRCGECKSMQVRAYAFRDCDCVRFAKLFVWLRKRVSVYWSRKQRTSKEKKM